ncbi:chemotaxis protein [Kiloniella spongiae]|uniref:Chemotaxis protein n=1 Tax=Kiloniella spongiae TaxID=1489064 RepID=A0A0H2MJE3_9PROT|nr:methyl-accepting chemotaxis protein [Kiloniella spongiae]KLN62518.1 chemotaxis protein [Kiloniella spongiae]
MSFNIGSRILAAAALIVVVTFSAFILYFDIHQSNEIRSSLKSKVIETGHLATNGISNWMSGRQLLIENIAENIQSSPTNETAWETINKEILKTAFLSTYFGNNEGDMTLFPDDPLPEDYDPRKRPWYIGTKQTQASFLTEPYVDAFSGNLIVTMASPVQDNSALLGVAGGDIEITTIVDLIRSVDLGGIGYAFLINDQGTVLIHPDKQWTLKPVGEVYPEETPVLSTEMQNFAEGSSDQIFAFFKVEGLPSVNWYLGLAIDRNAAFEELSNFRLTSIITAAIAVLAIMGLLGVLVRLWVSKPVIAMTDSMTNLASGNLDVNIPGQERKDEIGSMAAAVNVFKTNAIEMGRLAQENKESTERHARDRRETLNKMADSFEQSVLSIVETVVQASSNTQDVASQLTASAEESNVRTQAVSNAAIETSQNVQTVAAATEELSAAIREIGVQVTQSIQVTAEAVDGVNRTNGTVTELAGAAQRIGEVVKLISDVAGQTNLLALNATIEAARAGDAGKGFAVVASEVKTLANQTDQATGDIQTQVDGIQGASSQSVQEITNISSTIERMNEFANAIAAAIEEQGAATQEISNSVQKAAAGTQEVSSNVEVVTKASSQVSAEANNLLQSSREMQSMAENLRTEVQSFLSTVRES